jgi:hypothetical protein
MRPGKLHVTSPMATPARPRSPSNVSDAIAGPSGTREPAPVGGVVEEVTLGPSTVSFGGDAGAPLGTSTGVALAFSSVTATDDDGALAVIDERSPVRLPLSAQA